MTIDPATVSAAAREVQREVLVLRKQRDVQQQVAESLVELVTAAPPASAPARGRLSVYA